MAHVKWFGLLILLTAATVVAQTPKGWKLRVDRSTSAEDPDAAGDIQFLIKDNGFHATNPQAAVYWNASNTATGNYSVKGTFTMMQPAPHMEYYGLIFGGSDLDGPNQSYIYFLVAQDGTWLIKKRDGDSTQTIGAKTKNAAIKMPDSSGKATNSLEVRVSGDKVEYFVNGTLMQTTPKASLNAKTDGIAGIRINHHLEVQVDGFSVSKL